MLKFSKCVLFLTCCIAFDFAFAQDEECGEPEGKKIQKLLEQARNKNKYDRGERMHYLQQALEEDESCAPCYLELGELSFKRARASGKLSYNNAETHLSRLIEMCPEFHSDPYYYLGVIAYGKEDYKRALAYFTKFVDFQSEDRTKYARDFDRKYDDVKEILREVEFYANFFEDPVPFDPKVVEGVSSTGDEYLPMLSPDNELIFYTRKVERKSRGDLYSRQVEEFTMSKRTDIQSPFDGGVAMPSPFNVGDNYGGVTISINNKEMFITVCKPDDEGYNNCDIYVTNYEKIYNELEDRHEYVWSELENLGPNVNTADGWEAQPSLSSDGKTLYFATFRAESKATDIFYSARGEDGQWTKALPMPTPVNTEGHEKSPFIHLDGKTLYFAAKGQLGAGGYDLYVAKKQKDNTWSRPVNLGHPINSEEDEHGLIVSTDGKLAYYASNAISGSKGFDVFAFEIPENKRPDKILFMKGTVKDDQGKVMKDAKVELRYANSKKAIEIPVDDDDGKYVAVMNVQEGEDIVMNVKKDGYAFSSRVFSFKDSTASAVVNDLDVEIAEEEIGKPYRINDITYATSSAEITEASKLILDEFAAYLIGNPQIKIAIHGHTDDVGDDESNLQLSTDRASTVMEYLKGRGIQSSRLNYKGFGETKPIASNETEQGRAMNRRTEFVIVNK